jgi:hypothetical protein
MTAINQIVSVNSFYFRGRQQLRTYPRSVEFGNTTISFQDGLQYLVRKGQDIVQLFDMTDGHNVFRLKQEGNQWTLVGTKAGTLAGQL